jgi:hypothetical protein
MKRDMDLVRDILIQVEESTHTHGWCDINIEGRSPAEITYHVRMMHEQGLIEAQDLTTMSGVSWLPKRLTAQGHDFLDAARSEKVWTLAKEAVVEATGTLTLDALEYVMPTVMRQLVARRETEEDSD